MCKCQIFVIHPVYYVEYRYHTRIILYIIYIFHIFYISVFAERRKEKQHKSSGLCQHRGKHKHTQWYIFKQKERND